MMMVLLVVVLSPSLLQLLLQHQVQQQVMHARSSQISVLYHSYALLF
jgi:hypothetical protein